MKKSKKAVTLVELMVALTIMSVIVTGLLSGINFMSKHLSLTRSMVQERNNLSTFSLTLTSFLARSVSVSFQNTSGNINYVNLVDAANVGTANLFNITDTPDLDVVYVGKPSDSDATEGRIVYNADSKEIRWFKDDSTSYEVMLEGVYRLDNDDSNTQPIFRFPHADIHLYNTYGVHPRFLIVEFNKLIIEGTIMNPEPYYMPIKLVIPVGNIR